MHFSSIITSLAAATTVAAQVTSSIAPMSSAPAGCQPSMAGTFNIATVNVSTANAKRDLDLLPRQKSGILTLKLDGGILTDMAGRTGYLAANNQFQFDGPPQTGAIYTAGFSVCGNGSLALGGNAIFQACYSGDFYNLYQYTSDIPAQCTDIYIQAVTSGGASASSDGQVTAIPSATEKSEGQPGVTSVASSLATERSDGQPFGTTVGSVITEASDGQPVMPTPGSSGAPAPISMTVSSIVTEKSEGQPGVASTPASGSTVPSNIPAPVGSNSTMTSAPSGTGSGSGSGSSASSSPLAQSTAGAAQVVYNMAGAAMGLVGAMAFL